MVLSNHKLKMELSLTFSDKLQLFKLMKNDLQLTLNTDPELTHYTITAIMFTTSPAIITHLQG